MKKLKEIYNKNKILFLIVVLLIVGIGFTLAYYIPHISSGATGNVDTIVHTVDVLDFKIEPTSKVSMEIDQFNASPTGNSIKNKLTANAILKANSKTKTVTKKYSLYINIKNNNFIYTTGDAQTPENLVKITKNGVEVKEIPGLVYKTVDNAIGGAQSGFDITTKTGVLPIVENQIITDDYSNPEATIDTWELEFIHVNLATDQFENAGKKMDAEVLIVKNELANFAGILVPTVDDGSGLYHHNGTIKDSLGNIIDAGDDSYRYAGKEPNNYVCISSNASPCPNDNLYRIIGVFKNDVEKYQLKVIGVTEILNKAWNSKTNKNTADNKYNYWQWTEPDGTVKKADLNKYLNDSSDGFYQTLPEEIKNKIDKDAKWYINGYDTTKITPKKMHDVEINGNPIMAPIGLMYAHDYGFAVSEIWDKQLINYKPGKNWLGCNGNQWTITRNFSLSSNAFSVTMRGLVNSSSSVEFDYLVFPVYYLLSDIKIFNGDGTLQNPYQI